MEVKNYTLVKEEYIDEIKGTAYTFRHNKTKAEVCYLSTPDDDNKVFCIAFKTIPNNDKGIPHILEHCVLNGSRKFPVKEPFVELIKGSLNTFINAMTYDDKTVFPIASRNDKDFMNLMDVYLDAVLYPNLRKDPFIMQQEGWHYEMTDPDGPITYKGVVFNEMKGAFSDPDRQVFFDIVRNLFPDTTYGVESGGYPAAIPDLTYEEFCAFHERYYHPSNSRVFFYGNGDVEKHLSFLDEAYFSAFEYRDPNSDIPLQKPFDAPRSFTGHYAAADEEEGKAYLTYSVVLPPFKNAEEYYAASLLSSMLCGAEDAPIRKALTEAGIGADVSVEDDFGIQQPTWVIEAKDAKASDAERFKKIIREEVAKTVQNGFDPKLVEGIFNSTEFSLKEGDFGRAPKGLVLGLNMLDTWLYGSFPTDLLKYNEVFATLRQKAKEGYFEALAKQYVLDNPFTLTTVELPDKDMANRQQQEEEAKLIAYRDSLTKEQREQLCEETKQIMERQSAPDTPEALATIPLLQKEDLDTKAEQFPLSTTEAGGRPFWYYPVFTNGIVYNYLSFDLKVLEEAELPYAALLAEVLGSVKTDRHSHTELDNEINIYTGGLCTETEVYMNTVDAYAYESYFTVSAKYLASYEKQAFELTEEILLHSDLTDTKRLKEIISESRSGMESGIIRRGNAVALNRALSHLAEPYAVKEMTEGLSYYLFLKELEKNFSKKASEIAAKLQQVLNKIINCNTLVAMATLDEKQLAATKESVACFIQKLPAFKTEKKLRVKVVNENEALLTSGKVQYVVKAGKFTRPFRGSMEVLGKILGMDYLWTNVRVKGGAYGSGKVITRNGLAGLTSYRDPNLKETLAVYDNVVSYMKNFECSERELLKYIIGTVSDLSSPMTPSMKGTMAFKRHVCATSSASVQRVWDEVLSTTLAQIKEDAGVYEEAMSHATVCVLGSRERLNAEKELFDVLTEIM